MSSFTSSLIVSPMSDGHDWELVNKFTYHIGSKYGRRYISVPKCFITDFASVPKFLWFLPDWATYSKAPILHDWLYNTHTVMGKPITRKCADDIFLEAMEVDWRDHESRYIMAYIEYWAVRLFGIWAWNRKCEDGDDSVPIVT